MIPSKLFLGRQQVVAPIVDAHLDLRIVEDIEIRFAEVGGSGSRDQRLDFDDGLAFHSWIDGHRARRNSRAAADDQDRARVAAVRVVRCPSIRWSRMSRGTFEAWILPAT